MEDRNRPPISGADESSIVTTIKTSGSHHHGNPRTKHKKTNNNQQDQEEEGEEAQTREIEPGRLSEYPTNFSSTFSISCPPSINSYRPTGTLSKRWLRLWVTFVPNFLFNHVSSTAIVSSNDACEKFVSGVNRTLSQSRVSKIERFSILIPYLTSLASDVDSWLRFVTKNNVDHLTLNFIHMMYGEDYVLPQHLYANLSLKVLELMNCVVAPVGIVRWLEITQEVVFEYVRLSDDVMEGILSGCPVLEILEVRNYCGFNRLEVTSPSLREFCLSSFEHPFDEDDDDDDNDDEDAYLAISAPNLRVLTISSHFYAWNVSLEDVKSLVVADLNFNLVIDDTVEDFDKCSDLLQELLEDLHHVKELKLANWCIQVLTLLEVKALPSPLLNCKSLTLDMADGDLPGIAKLLNISPYPEMLVISTETLSPSEIFVGDALNGYFVSGEDYFQLPKTPPEGSLLHLKKVKIFGFRRVFRTVELVQFLLKNAEVLENMNRYAKGRF